MLRVLLERGILMLLPFAAWFLWREVSRRTGRPMGSTPWAWLFAVGAVMMGLSLMASAMFHSDNRAETYVPAETLSDGQVTPGHFEQKAAPKP